MSLAAAYMFGKKEKELSLDNLELYLKYSGNDNDSSTNGLNTFGTSNFGPGIYSGIANHSALFNSSSHITTVDNQPPINFGNGTTDSDFTLSIVIKPSTNGQRRTLISKGNFRDNNNREYNLELQSDNKIQFLIYQESTNQFKRIITDQTFTSGNIYTIDAVYFDGDLFLYSNSVLLTTALTDTGSYVAMELGTTRLQIAKQLAFNAFPFTGNVDEVQAWSRALSSSEISLKYNITSSGLLLF